MVPPPGTITRNQTGPENPTLKPNQKVQKIILKYSCIPKISIILNFEIARNPKNTIL